MQEAVHLSRLATDAQAGVLRAVSHLLEAEATLTHIVSSLPEPDPRMLDLEIAEDVPGHLVGLLGAVLEDYLRPAIKTLLTAGRVSDRELASRFAAFQAQLSQPLETTDDPSKPLTFKRPEADRRPDGTD